MADKTVELDNIASINGKVTENIVYVTIPEEAFSNLKFFQNIQACVMKRLGHSSCTSGYDIRWIRERHFVSDLRGNIKAIPALNAVHEMHIENVT